MEILATVAFSLGVIAYSVATTLYFLELVRSRTEMRSSLSSSVLGLGVGCHAVHLWVASQFTHTCPVESIQFALSAAALVAAISFLVLRRGREIDALGVFVGPLSLTFLLAAQFVGAAPPPAEISRLLLGLHIMANLLGLGFVLLAGGSAVFYLVVERRLKQKRMGQGKGRLPALDVLDRLGHRLLLVGFPLLTFGVVSGALFFAQLGELSGLSFARSILGYVTWTLVGGVLLSRALFGFRGRRSAYGTLWGVLCLTLLLLVYVLRPLLGVVA